MPFADADDAAFFGFELAEGMYPDPILVDTTAFDRDGGRPSADDLEWMAAVMPAVAAFCVLADQGPHSAVEPIAALLRAAFGHGSDDIIV